MATILFNGAEPFDKICQHPFDRRPHVKSNENCSSGFREDCVYVLYDFIHVYSPGAQADNPHNFYGIVVNILSTEGLM